ncbi:MAG: hypothetical protein PHX44_09200 [Sulfurimonas sp.]|uniref:hypothetical protein n=1 Tax=Sulfurimonas sp. TaxID=2022749 RepID=UPI00261D05BB|nr:hypothetical protein [Sulfurimonas sp.]MDD2653210.1 hypothetical protein [Sulfurimonas sp.]MDD3452535.1 hypothetical protein [Sulfurimonas sp.]
MCRLFLFFSLCFSALNADFLHVDSPSARLSDFVYKTPNDGVVKIPKDVKIVIASFEKETGALVNSYLQSQDTAYLSEHQAVFIADISKMPSVITTMFAIPKLKKYKHPIHINYSEGFDTVVPAKEDMVTLLFVENAKIKEIRYAATKDELKAAIEK